MKTILYLINLVLLFAGISYSFQTTSESTNPFNQFMSPSGGINLYSGDVAYTHPFATVSGRGGMDINLSLAYSSNIYSQVHCGNDRAPTGWTGLGWRMGFGSIIRDHKGTKNAADDDFIWITPAGVPNRLTKAVGLKCYVYTGSWTQMPDFDTLTPVDSSITNAINIQQRGLYLDTFALVFEGQINCGAGEFIFTLTSDDGSKLYIDNNLVLDYDNTHSCLPESTTTPVTLTGNHHHLRLEYFQYTGDLCLKLEYRYANEQATADREFAPNQLLPSIDPAEEVWDFGRYYLENDPYTRIETKTDDAGNIIWWIVTTTDGKRMIYGDSLLTSPEKSTRYTFAFGDYVGQGWGTTPTLYPYQWDLNKITDIAGNTLQFAYQQEPEALRVGTWNSANLTPPLYYTKASYLQSITTPEGKHVDFEIEVKPDNEPYDPYRFEDEPDGFMEMFESSRLKTVKVYSIPGSSVETGRYTFSYDQYRDEGTDNKYLKSYLTRIVQESNGLTGSSTRFEYNNNFSSTDVNYHEGALHRVVDDKSSAVTEFTYTRQTIPTEKTSDQPPDGQTRHGTYSGITNDGNPYIVCRGGDDEHPRLMEIFNWTGSKWEKTYDWQALGTPYWDIDIFALKGHVVVRGGNDDYIQILTWDGKRWYVSLSRTKFAESGYQVAVYPGTDYIAFVTGENMNKMEIINWRDNQWVTTYPRQTVVVNAGTHPITLWPNGQHILASNGQAVAIFTYNGTSWPRTLESEIIDPSNTITVHPGTNFYAFRLGGWHRLLVKSWNGSTWVTTLPSKDLSMNGHDFEIQGFNENILLRHNADDYLQILSWTGTTWDSTFARDQITTSTFDFDKIGPDYIPLRHAADAATNEMEILQWNAATIHWDTPFPRQPVGIGNNDIDFFPSQDYVVIKVGSTVLQSYRNNGTSWNRVLFNAPFASQNFEVSAVGPAFAILGSTNELKCYYKYQDQFNEPLATYTVTRKKVTDPYARGGTALTTTYDYNLSTNANFDTRAGCAKFNKVDITTAGAGKATQYFFNDVVTQADITSNYDEFDGMVYKTETSNGSGVIIDSSKSTYEIFRKSYWPVTVRQKRTTSTSTWNRGVESRTDMLKYNIWNGLPTITRTSNSDETQKLSKTIFAFECVNPNYRALMGGSFKYEEREAFVLGAYMLTAPFLNVVYEKAPGSTAIEPAAAEVRSAQATTYAYTLGCKAMLPDKQYVWKSEYNPDGTLKENYANYNPYTGTNPNWVLTGSTDLYSNRGIPLQTSNAAGVPTTVLFSNDSTLPVMNVANAQYGSCLFTNWTENQPIAVNIAIMAMSSAPADRHIAGRTMKLTTNTTNTAGDQYAVAAVTPVDSNLSVLGGKSYTVQFWAKSDRTAKTFVHLQAVPGLAWSDYQNIDLTTEWKKYELKLSFPAGNTDQQYQLLLRPPHIPGSTYTEGTIWYDDVRVAPSTAQSTVTYYDPVWRKPVLTLDVNNNPGTKVTLDGLGRPVLVEKINPLKSADQTGYATTIQRKTYHRRSDLPANSHIQLLSPNGGENLAGVSTVSLRWVSDGLSSQVGFSYQLRTGDEWGEWQGIGTVPNEAGECSYDWDIPAGITINNDCRIEAIFGHSPGESDISDTSFFLSTP